ncbi:UNVERIFIED_ORG: hypothetical protein ABIC48_006059 [Burkholderia territorii]
MIRRCKRSSSESPDASHHRSIPSDTAFRLCPTFTRIREAPGYPGGSLPPNRKRSVNNNAADKL